MILDKTIYEKAQTVSAINTMVASFQKAQQPIIFTRHTNKTSLIYESALWTLDATLDCPEESLIFDKRRSNIFDEPGFEKLL